MNNGLGRMWKETDMISFVVLSQHLPGGMGENHENLSQDSQSLG
jgi:hypothetical protein